MSDTLRMDRRRFIRNVGAAAAALPLLGGVSTRLAQAEEAAAAVKPDPRPNILFCIGDDWGWPSAGALGDKVVRTPTFDRVAREGVLFPYTYCASPSCTPSRGSILTGQMFYRLETGANLHTILPKKFEVYPDRLEAAGYHVGLTRKGWGPGKPGDWTRNQAGPQYKTFEEFHKSVPAGKPFCFWFGSTDPHRGYDAGSGIRSGLKPEDVAVPPFFPDAPEIRSDICDYYCEIERCDREIGEMMALLEKAGQLENTIVVITGDNGWPFPRGKTNLYDHGVRQPLAVRWAAKAKPGRVIEDFISFTDFAPTFLEAAGVKPLAAATGRSFLGLLTGGQAGRVDPARGQVVVGRERHHGGARPGCVGFPMRAIRTHDYLYIKNFMPDRWPVGDPPDYADTDGGPTKSYILAHKDDPKVAPAYELCFAKRPAEELYDCRKDPFQIKNVAADPAYADAKAPMAAALEKYLTDTKDPRVVGGGEAFDQYPYTGNLDSNKMAPGKGAPAGKKKGKKEA